MTTRLHRRPPLTLPRLRRRWDDNERLALMILLGTIFLALACGWVGHSVWLWWRGVC